MSPTAADDPAYPITLDCKDREEAFLVVMALKAGATSVKDAGTRDAYEHLKQQALEQLLAHD